MCQLGRIKRRKIAREARILCPRALRMDEKYIFHGGNNRKRLTIGGNRGKDIIIETLMERKHWQRYRFP